MEKWYMTIVYDENIKGESNATLASLVLGTHTWKIRLIYNSYKFFDFAEVSCMAFALCKSTTLSIFLIFS